MTKKVWDKFFKDQKNIKKFGKHVFDYSKPDNNIVNLVPFFKKKKIIKVLDLGCGNGRNSKFLSAKDFNVVGIDISKIAIRLAKKQDQKSYYKVADMLKLPFPNNYFDATISIQTIFHELLTNIRKTIKEIIRVNKNKAIVFITLQPVYGNKYRMGQKLEKETYISNTGDDKGEIHHFFTKKEILKEFAKFGFIDFHLEFKKNYWYLLLRNQK